MTERVVLLGEGIGYSASPAIHNAAFAALGMPWRYELRDIPAAALLAVFAELREGSLRGANITRPHKVRVLEFTDELARSADRVGAVNTIVVRDGRLIGHNTDVPAIAEELAILAGAAHATPGRSAAAHSGSAVEGPFRSVVILGRGGGARAVARVLLDSRASVELVGRDRWADSFHPPVLGARREVQTKSP